MKEDLIKYITEQEITLFNEQESILKQKVKPKIYTNSSIYKTKDAKAIHSKIMNKMASNYQLQNTWQILNYFEFSTEENDILKRQKFFEKYLGNSDLDVDFLKELKKSNVTWKPKYSILAVTEDEQTYLELKKQKIPCQLMISEQDVEELANYEIIQVVNCEKYELILENLSQTVFLDSVEDVYLEKHLITLSTWKENLKILKNTQTPEIKEIVAQLTKLLDLLAEENLITITSELAQKKLEEINETIQEKIQNLTIQGTQLFEALSIKQYPIEIKQIIKDTIKEKQFFEEIFNQEIPVTINEEELEEKIRKQNEEKHTLFSEKIKNNKEEIKKIPQLLKKLEQELIFLDFTSGVNRIQGAGHSVQGAAVREQSAEGNRVQESASGIQVVEFPKITKDFVIKNALNYLIQKPESITFELNEENKASILTGANSGGKTTLLEHVIQIISLTNLGIKINGFVETPLFTEVYYFAKNKGSANKGAFETLLNQMSKIKPGKNTLILADEIEAVTEPGVAGNIIAATTNYFIQKNCFLIIATHLGHEVKKMLPNKTRIDGIEAKGLDEKFNLIIDHAPVMGKLANSTPELIIEKLANTKKEQYYKHIHEFLKV
ncbi:hypothetical protein K9L67_00085 [Candidatus Woesearchaeota archaeon]|nr:hypothetical protein [Candidatus Woesearchaeota archaeon]MCF7900605.1 hypothetical protein [Candidatus Woesearchaeota archaeon]MCF8013905.1 hypothetical protein [Candidatus Woesearchaeota archaeon]